MQARMKDHPLSESQVQALLESEQVGRLATLGEDGYPYITPVHFVYMQGNIFIHGLAAGEKLRNIETDARVGFEIEKMTGYIHDAEKPCGTNTEYESVIIRGKATLVESQEAKVPVLDAIVKKYTPQHTGKPFPPEALRKTGVIRLEITSCTGKYYSDQA